MKLLTVFDDNEPIDNVLPALTLDVDEVFYLFHHFHGKTLYYITKILKKYKPDLKVRFVRVFSDNRDIDRIINHHDDLIIDVGGSKYLSLVLFEKALSTQNIIIYYDNQENNIKSYRDHSVLATEVFKLTIEDSLNLGGGEIVRNLHITPGKNDRETANAVKGIITDTASRYSAFISYVQSVNKIIGYDHSNQTRFQLKDAEVSELKKSSMYEACVKNNLFYLKDNTLEYLNTRIVDMFEVSGSFLENYLYLTLEESGLFDEVMMSVVVDFSSRENTSQQIICELDALVIRDNHLSFISCKSNKVDTSALNEIKLHSLMFGNVLSSACLCTLDNLDKKSPSVYAKAKELQVAIIDQTSFVNQTIVEDTLSVVEKRFEYEKLPN